MRGLLAEGGGLLEVHPRSCLHSAGACSGAGAIRPRPRGETWQPDRSRLTRPRLTLTRFGLTGIGSGLTQTGPEMTLTRPRLTFTAPMLTWRGPSLCQMILRHGDDSLSLKEGEMIQDKDGVRYGPIAANDSDPRIFNAKQLCPDGCPPCKGCGVHMDSWWYFLNGGYCNGYQAGV